MRVQITGPMKNQMVFGMIFKYRDEAIPL